MRYVFLFLFAAAVVALADDLVRTDARSVMYIYHSGQRILLPEGQYFSWMSSTLFDNHPDTVVTFVQIYRRPAAYWSAVRAAHFIDSMRVTRHAPLDSMYKWMHIRMGKKHNQGNPFVDIFEAGRPGGWWFSGPYDFRTSPEGSLFIFPEWGVNGPNLVDPLRDLGQSGDSTFPYLAFHYWIHQPSETLYFYPDYPTPECKLSMWFDRQGEEPPPFPEEYEDFIVVPPDSTGERWFIPLETSNYAMEIFRHRCPMPLMTDNIDVMDGSDYLLEPPPELLVFGELYAIFHAESGERLVFGLTMVPTER